MCRRNDAAGSSHGIVVQPYRTQKHALLTYASTIHALINATISTLHTPYSSRPRSPRNIHSQVRLPIFALALLSHRGFGAGASRRAGKQQERRHERRRDRGGLLSPRTAAPAQVPRQIRPHGSQCYSNRAASPSSVERSEGFRSRFADASTRERPHAPAGVAQRVRCHTRRVQPLGC